MGLRRPANVRRFTNRSVLDVRLRAQGPRLARLRLVGAALGAAVATVLCLYAVWHAGEWLLQRLVFDNEAFAVQKIVILNDGTLSEADVLRWAGVRRGDNLLALDLTRVQRDLQLVPLIRFAAVERVPPDTLRIRIEERQPLARLMAPRFGVLNQEITFVPYCIDAEGYVFTMGGAGLPSQPAWRADLPLPWLRGFEAAEVLPGRTLTLPAVRAALTLLDAFRRSPAAGLVDVAGIDLSVPGILGVEAGASRVTFSYDRPEEQLRRWALVLEYAQKQGKTIQTLDLSVTNNSPVTFLEAARAPDAPAKPVLPPTPKKRHV
jgi:hypothetical protein